MRLSRFTEDTRVQRGFTLLTVLLCSNLMLVVGSWADTPTESTPAAERRIRGALNGDAATGHSSDALLSDVLGVIRRRGSRYRPVITNGV